MVEHIVTMGLKGFNMVKKHCNNNHNKVNYNT